MINPVMKDRLKFITDESLKLYLDFWGFDGLSFGDEDELSSAIRSEVSDCFIDTACSMAISAEGTVTPSQFLYDIEVFAGVYIGIRERISMDNFAAFVNVMQERTKQNGWETFFAVDNALFRIIKEHGAVISVVDQAHCAAKTILVVNGVGDANSYYERYKTSFRVAKHFLLEYIREWIITEICDHFKQKLSEKGVALYLGNWSWAQNNVLYPQTAPTSAQIDERKSVSIYNIAGDEKNHSDFLHEMYGDYTDEYITGIFDIPPKLALGKGKIRHSDKTSRYVNVVSGERYTPDQPKDYKNTIYMLGGCVFFGYAIDDGGTISGALQKILNERCGEHSWRVCNYGTWGGNIDQTYATLFELNFKPGDVVLISYAGLLPVGDCDISDNIGRAYSGKEFYYDGVFHCNADGYRAAAENICNIVETRLSGHTEGEMFRLVNEDRADDNRLLMEYISETKKLIPAELTSVETTGAIVMNCNPFTLGHRYLIEYASSRVDCLIIFVVEEDKSFFPFRDRIELVRRGTADLKNVVVVPSGSFIISTVTFPGYFMKDNPKEAVLDSSQDVETFAKSIAPHFDVSVRFVGEEPIDIVTRRYNDTLEKILPQYGIRFVEIPRKTSGDAVISASRVRAALKEKDFGSISRIVPPTTFEYLKNRFAE